MSQQVHDPNRRQRYEFHPEGENVIVDVWVEPGGDVPPHYHPSQEERFSVLEGRVRFKVGGRKVIAGAGDELVASPGVKHAFKNVGDNEARMRVEVRPALDLQEFMESAAELAQEGLYTRRGIPTSLKGAVRMAEFIDRHREGTVICSPPPAVQRVLLAPLLRFSRRRGRGNDTAPAARV
jgi:quercetin dioxygenase-like cupin family protein